MLDKIWDDTLGGPQPDSGLRRLRNNSSFNTTQASEAGKLQVSPVDIEEMNLKEGSGGIRVIGKPQKFSFQRSLSMENNSPPSSPTAASSSSASSTPRDRENVWRSVFNPGVISIARQLGLKNSTNQNHRALRFMTGSTVERVDPNGVKDHLLLPGSPAS